MDEQVIHEIVDEVLSSLEPLDTQASAILQFLKAKGIAREEDLAPFLEQAGNASNVRWLAARVRIKSLLSSAMRTEEPKPSVQEPTTASAENKENKKIEDQKPSAEAKQEPDSKKRVERAPRDEEKEGSRPRPENAAPVAREKDESAKQLKPTTPEADSQSHADSKKDAA